MTSCNRTSGIVLIFFVLFCFCLFLFLFLFFFLKVLKSVSVAPARSVLVTPATLYCSPQLTSFLSLIRKLFSFFCF